MAKTKISEYSATSANNTDISNINIAEGCSPANVNNAIRTVMAQLKDQQAGTSGDNFTVGGNLAVTGTTTLTGATTVTGATILNGATTVNGALTLTSTIPVANGGTSLATLPTGNLLVGNATSAVSSVTPALNGESLIVTAGSSVTAGSFVVGGTYTITSVGTTSFTAIGASANTVGIAFTATGVGSGTGTATLNTWSAGSSIISGTSQASTSGTSINFTSIPSWIKRITVMYSGLSTSGSSIPIIQLGTGATPTYTTTGYLGTVATFTSGVSVNDYTSGFMLGETAAGARGGGQFVFSNLSGNTWVGTGMLGRSDLKVINSSSGSVPLGAVLTAIRLTTANGTDTFDAGSVNIMYE